ncbi:unnamed protein product [Mucor fragilis]
MSINRRSLHAQQPSAAPLPRPNDAINDLSSVDHLTDKRLTDILQQKFLNYNVYSDIGACHLVAVNPFKELAQNDAQTSDDYITSYKDAPVDAALSARPILSSRLNPHVFELVNRAFFHMRRTGNDQSIFLCGESGSGKTEISNLVIRHLMRLGANKKRSKVQNHIIHGHQVLQAFGCAKTSFNDTAASRYGVYMETHYNERGKMVGAKTLHYFLETSRLCQGKLGEGNFNVFYWLLAGTEPDEKQVLQLKDDPKAYHYLASYGRMLQSSDADEYNQLKGVMRAAGFRGEHFNRIIQLLAAILHLGNIAFTDAAAATDASATIKNRDTLECVAEMLGLDARALETVLCFRTTMIGKDVTTLILKADQAAAQRDELAQTLYSLLFSWLVEHTNQKTYTDQFNSFIGMLDFPGTQPSGFGSVGFEQFCIDYANERIYNFIMHRTFESDDAEFQAEAIQVPAVAADFTNNTACIDLYEKPTRGINAILNKMSEKTISGKRLFTDANAMEAIAKYNSDNPSFASKLSDTNARQFAIQHYAGQVTYEPTGFIAKTTISCRST